MTSIDKQINKIFSSISGYPEELFNKDIKIMDIKITSLMIIQIIVRIEEEFSIEIDEEYLDLSKYETMEDLYNIVNKTLQA